VFQEVSSTTLDRPSFEAGSKPKSAVIFLAHDGGWSRTILAAGVGILLISVAFEIIRRVFYYVIIGKVVPVE
jgi:hypothetical protein